MVDSKRFIINWENASHRMGGQLKSDEMPRISLRSSDKYVGLRRALMPHSTTHWVHQLKAGNRDAAQELWERYYRRLVELARRRLSTKAVNGVADEDDIALSAFASFYRAAEAGRFPQLADRNDLCACF